jgi:hypothetical protein
MEIKANSLGAARINMNDKRGFLDKNKNSVVACINESKGDFDNVIVRLEINKKNGFIN